MLKIGNSVSTIVYTNFIVFFLRIISSVIVTRFLHPSDFGVIGIIISVSYIAAMISNTGLFAFVVRHENGLDPTFLDEVWTLRFLRGAALATLIGLAAFPIAAFLGDMSLAAPIGLAGLFLFVEAIGSMTFATAARQGKVARLTAVDFISVVVQIFLQIILAIWLRSYWAICYAMLVSATLKAALSYYMFGQGLHRWRLSRLRLLEAWSFGKHFVGSSLIEIVISQTDKLFLARFMPISLYGQYVLAGNLSAGPTSLVQSFNSRILFPAFAASRTQDIGDRVTTYYNTGKWLRQAFAFGSGGLIALSPLIVETLYDDRYRSVSQFLQLLSLITLVRFSASISTDYLVATDSPKHYLRLNLARMVTLVTTGFVGYHYMGAIGIVLALIVAECVGQIYNWVCLFGKGILSLRSELLFWVLAVIGYMVGWCVNEFSFRHVVPLFKAGLGA